MSVDNIVMIVKTKRTALEKTRGVWYINKPNFVFRVGHAHAYSDLLNYLQKQPYNVGAYLVSILKDSPVFTDIEAAKEWANNLEVMQGYVQHGVKEIDFTEYVYFGDM